MTREMQITGTIKEITQYTDGTTQVALDRRLYIHVPEGETRAEILERSFPFYLGLDESYLGQDATLTEREKPDGTIVQRLEGRDFMFDAQASRETRENTWQNPRTISQVFKLSDSKK